MPVTNSRNWWRTGKPGVLQSWGRKESDSIEQLNWTELMPVAIRQLFFKINNPKYSIGEIRVSWRQARLSSAYSLWSSTHTPLPTPKLRAAGMWKHDWQGGKGFWCQLQTKYYAPAFLGNILSLIVREKESFSLWLSILFNQ